MKGFMLLAVGCLALSSVVGCAAETEPGAPSNPTPETTNTQDPELMVLLETDLIDNGAAVSELTNTNQFSTNTVEERSTVELKTPVRPIWIDYPAK